jgi:hypothetical protein
MHEIKSFNVWQTSKVLAVLYAISGWIEGIFLALAALRHGHPFRAIFCIVILPIIFGVLGFLFTAFSCWLYNQVAEQLGGIAFELVPRSDN